MLFCRKWSSWPLSLNLTKIKIRMVNHDRDYCLCGKQCNLVSLKSDHNDSNRTMKNLYSLFCFQYSFYPNEYRMELLSVTLHLLNMSMSKYIYQILAYVKPIHIYNIIYIIIISNIICNSKFVTQRQDLHHSLSNLINLNIQYLGFTEWLRTYASDKLIIICYLDSLQDKVEGVFPTAACVTVVL